MNTVDLRKIIFETVDFLYDGEIETYENDCLEVFYDGSSAKIGYKNISQLCRGYFLFAKNFSKGSFHIKEKAHFETCGCMIDASRNGVITVEAAKKYINYMAALGLNMLMLYTEDTYEVEGYPHFGYMRGRYSCEELKEIDSYAKQLGVELIPCIQTLGHLAQFLRYECTAEYRDTFHILLCDCEKTYEFIEAELKAVKAAYSSKKIHIGMDEAFDLGLGKYLELHGYQKRYNILLKHMNRVVELCKKYDLEPMVWADMFFRTSTPDGSYFNYEDAVFSEEMLKNIPDVDIVYWDYYSEGSEFYSGMLRKTKELGKNTVFAGGIAIWYEFLPRFKDSYMYSSVALGECLKNDIKDVVATMWGDHGNETNVFLSVPYLPVYAEYCYKGNEVTPEDIEASSEFLTKIPWKVTEAMGNGYGGRNYFYNDILYGAGTEKEEYQEFLNHCRKSYDIIEEQYKLSPENGWYEYALRLYDIYMSKAEMYLKIRDAYGADNTEYFGELATKTLPELKEKYIKFKELHKKQWHDTHKTFGFETLSYRYGGIVSRIDDCIEIFKNYANGTITKIDILEEEYQKLGNDMLPSIIR